MVECAHRQLKDALRAREAGAEWPDHLAWVLMGLCAAPKESNGVSSAQLVFGQPLILPGELTDIQEAAAYNFITQLASSELPPTCQPRSSFSTVHPHSSQGGQICVRAERRQRASPGSSLLRAQGVCAGGGSQPGEGDSGQT